MRHSRPRSPLPGMVRRKELRVRVDRNPATPSHRRRRRRSGPISWLSSTCELHHVVCEIELRHARHSRRKRTSTRFYMVCNGNALGSQARRILNLSRYAPIYATSK